MKKILQNKPDRRGEIWRAGRTQCNFTDRCGVWVRRGPVLRVAVTALMFCAAVVWSGFSATQALANCGPAPGYQPIAGDRTTVVDLRPSPELAALGQRLFFDRRFSATGGTACARCHDSGYAYTTPLP